MANTHATIAAVLFTALAFGGCGEPASVQPAPVAVGADRDAHGCIGSAGYRWCERDKACTRPWELAAQRGFPNTPEGFGQYCGGK
ncbi:MAG: hypothetical protein ACKO5J_04050 [Rubrivivax sp.]